MLFRSISASVAAPTRMMATPPASKKITLRVGKTKKLSVKNAGKKVKAKWKSKSKKIATVSKKGKVKAKKAGKTWITCKFKYKGKKYTLKCKVTVKKKLVPTKKPVKSKKPVNTQKINTGNPNKTDGAVKTESPSGSNLTMHRSSGDEVRVLTPKGGKIDIRI